MCCRLPAGRSTGACRYDIPAEVAATVADTSAAAQARSRCDDCRRDSRDGGRSADPSGKSRRFERIATELSSPEQVLEHLQALLRARRAALRLDRPFVAPRNEIESALTEILGQSVAGRSGGNQRQFLQPGRNFLTERRPLRPDRAAVRQEAAVDLADRSSDRGDSWPTWSAGRQPVETPWC